MIHFIGLILGVIMVVNFIGELFPPHRNEAPLEPQPFPCSGRELVYYLIVLIALVAAFSYAGK